MPRKPQPAHLANLVALNEAVFTPGVDGGRDRALAERQAYLAQHPEAVQFYGQALMTVVYQHREEQVNG